MAGNPRPFIIWEMPSPMRYKVPSLAAAAISACAVLAACGTTGTTSRFTLLLDLPAREKVAGDMRIASAAMEADDAATLNAIKVQPWGKFGPEDLKNIELSLQDTISPHLVAPSPPGAARIDLHLVVRRYVVSTSNTAGAVLACVAWAATTPEGSVIYQEQFYASDAGYLVTTIGRIKDSVHEAIVRRIAETSLAIAARPGERAPPRRFDKTSSSFEEAASRLPKTMVSLGDPGLASFPDRTVSVVGLLTPSGVETIEWAVAHPSAAFDWAGYLKKLY